VAKFTEPQILFALRSPSTSATVEKTVKFLALFEDAVQGVLVEYDPATNMLGSVNRGNVTCYIDSLLFSMFSRNDSFESILTAHYSDPAKATLVILLRFWVNMVRSGMLVTTDIVGRLPPQHAITC
jgi:hypothetical protein